MYQNKHWLYFLTSIANIVDFLDVLQYSESSWFCKDDPEYLRITETLMKLNNRKVFHRWIFGKEASVLSYFAQPIRLKGSLVLFLSSEKSLMHDQD